MRGGASPSPSATAPGIEGCAVADRAGRATGPAGRLVHSGSLASLPSWCGLLEGIVAALRHN